MEQLEQKENNMNYSNKQSTLDTNKSSILFCNNGNYFSFGKDNTLINKFNTNPNTSSFNIKESLTKVGDINKNSNNFLNKKRKLMTSEELELEQIERERKEVKKMMQKNMALYYKTKSGTTTIVSKIKDDIYGSNNNIYRNSLLNNYIKNNKATININKFNPTIDKNNNYAKNIMKEKEINKNNETQKIVNANKNIKNTEISFAPHKKKVIEIINTDINNKTSINNESILNDGNNTKFEDEKGKEEVKIIGNIDEENYIEFEKKNIEKEGDNFDIKTPNKESSYLTKIKKLGSMSKLPLSNKIQKYTEICREILKEQELENFIVEKVKSKKGQKRKKKSKKVRNKY